MKKTNEAFNLKLRLMKQINDVLKKNNVSVSRMDLSIKAKEKVILGEDGVDLTGTLMINFNSSITESEAERKGKTFELEDEILDEDYLGEDK